MTLEQVIRNIPRATAQLHNHTATLPAIAQSAQVYRCHSNELSFEGRVTYPTRRRRKMSVRNGIEASSMRSKIAGDNASRNELSTRRWVVRVRVDEAT